MICSRLFKKAFFNVSIKSTRTLTTSVPSIQTSNIYCRDLVKKHDYENYLVGLLCPTPHRDAFFAIRAFNVEIATIKEQIPRNTLHAGRLRFQFWKTILDSIYDCTDALPGSSHPISHALHSAVQRNKLSKRWFERSLEARYLYWRNETLYYE